MAADIKLLKSRGISSESYKKIFTADKSKQPARVKKLIQLISDRVRSGRQTNLRDYRKWWAIDLAYDEPVNSMKPTLLKNFLSHKWANADEAFKALGEWGLLESDVFMNVTLEDGTPAKMINPPILYQTLIPIVQTYTKARLSRIFNDRNQSPLLQYNPLKMTTMNQLLCEVVTDIVNTISTWYGYPIVLHDAIQQMLKYGISIAFPREEWHYEKQIVFDENGKEKKVTTKEGIRYIFPHPSRMFYDMLYPVSSINSDTGCEFGGHWHVLRYGDVLDNKEYWNRDSILYGTNWFQEPSVGNYFREAFPCQLEFPVVPPNTGRREDNVSVYGSQSNDRDKALFVTEVFMKINPRDWGLGEYEDDKLKKLTKTYNFPVWHHFTIAGDDTVIWAEPCAYTPMWFMGYDYDQGTARNSSLALECMPTQDQVSNFISQMLITSKENLANAIFYDTQVVDKKDIEQLRNKGEKQFRELNFIGYDSYKMAKSGASVDKAFHPVTLPKQDINQLLQMVNTVLNLLERTLQITAQETGAAASHQQSKEEVQQTSGASSQRLTYTCSFVDEGIDAWKAQLFTGFKAYGDAAISAQVSSDIPKLEEHLKQLGLTPKSTGDEKVLVTGQKNTLSRLESFARTNEGPNAAVNKEQAQTIFNTMQTISGQEELRKKIGAKNILKMIEWAAQLGGAPRGFRLQIDEDAKDDAVPQVILEAIKQAQQATLQTVEEKIAKPAAQEIAQNQQQIQEMRGLVEKFNGIFEIAQAEQNKLKIKQAEAEQRMQQREQEFTADMQRKQQEHDLKLQTMVEEASTRISIEQQKAAAKIGSEKGASATG